METNETSKYTFSKIFKYGTFIFFLLFMIVNVILTFTYFPDTTTPENNSNKQQIVKEIIPESSQNPSLYRFNPIETKIVSPNYIYVINDPGDFSSYEFKNGLLQPQTFFTIQQFYKYADIPSSLIIYFEYKSILFEYDVNVMSQTTISGKQCNKELIL